MTVGELAKWGAPAAADKNDDCLVLAFVFSGSASLKDNFKTLYFAT